MSSPLNDPSVTDWFRRFDAAAKHLPADDRAAQHEELRQHLDALAAANVALGQSPETARQNALTRLGDPSQIGRKLDCEWRQGGTSSLAIVLSTLGIQVTFGVLLFYARPHAFALAYFVCVPLLVGAIIGVVSPRQAFRSLLYPAIVLPFAELIAPAAPQAYRVLSDPTSIVLWPTVWVLLSFLSAYLTSVARRGWYRPSLADFTLSLPQKKARA